MPNSKISIIIPFYNQSKKILDCLESIKKQTFKNFEVIVVNDGSKDIKHIDLVRQIKNNISFARCLYQENQGAPSARNKGFSESNGKYIIFCDADIVMKPDMLEKMAFILDKNPEVSYVYSSFKFGWKIFKLWEFDAQKLHEMPYIHTTSMIRREHFPGFDESFERFQDWDLWLTMLENGFMGKWINETLFQVKSGGTISSWAPSFFIKLGIGKHSREYKQARVNILQKHAK